MSKDLNISIEDHLRSSLRNIQPHLPTDLLLQLKPYLSPQQEHIPYSLLASISAYTRSDAFSPSSCGLDKNDYTMISILAGTTTSPDRRFPDVVPVISDDRSKGDRKAITALLNALLSIIGAGVAIWWASERLLWSIEYVSCCYSIRIHNT